MKFSTTIAAALAIGFSFASPIEVQVQKRHTVYTPKVDDGIILNYALTLEYLERKFYQEAIRKFSRDDFKHAGFADPFYDNLLEIYEDEKTHVTVLDGALKAAKITPTNELEYKFGLTDVKSFVTLSSVLEGVGVTAYLGAAAFIINKDYLTVAGAILTIEARHSAYLRSKLQQSPFPAPFDTPLDFNQVYSLAAQFISGGTSPVKLPFKAFPTLTLAPSQGYYEAESSSITFVGALTNAQSFDPKINHETPLYAVFFAGLVKTAVKLSVQNQSKDLKVDKIPAGVQGPTYIVLSRSNTKFTDEEYIAGPAIIETYPKGRSPKNPTSYA